MANETTTKSKRFYCVSLVPDICKTPIGPATPPIPYSIIGEFADATNVSRNVKSLGEPVILHQRSTIPTVKGDEPGTAGGIKSGTFGKCVETKTASATLRANGTATVQEGCEVWMNNRNTIGKIYERGGAIPRSRLQQIQALVSEQTATAVAEARENLKPLAQDYKDNKSASLHESGTKAMEAGGNVLLVSAVVGAAGVLVGLTGIGLPIAAGMEGVAVDGAVTGTKLVLTGAVAETSATVLDLAADFVLTGKTPDMERAMVDAGISLLEAGLMVRGGGAVRWMLGKFSSLGKLFKGRPGLGKKQEKPPPARPPDKPTGGKSKGGKKDAKSDKPSDCCPKNAAPGGKPVSGRKPVHFGTGEEVLYQTDFVLEGPQPIAWTRCYRSGSEHEDWGMLGARWSSPFTSSLLLAANGIVYVDDSGRGARLAKLAIGQSLDNRSEGFVLTRSSVDTFQLTWRDGGQDTFTRDEGGQESWLPHGYDGVNAMRTPGAATRAERFSLRRTAGRDGSGVSVERFGEAAPRGLLLRIRSDDGRILEALGSEQIESRQNASRIGQVDEVRADGTRICHVRYAYEAEVNRSAIPPPPDAARQPVRFNLVSQINIAGHARHYRYRHHLLQSCTGYGGFTHTLSWVSLAELRERWRGGTLDEDTAVSRFPITLDNSYQARAIATAGEDGTDALRIDYPTHDSTRVTDAVGGVLEYTFDENWLAVEVRRIDADGVAVSLGRRDWDRDGMLLAEVDAAGHGARYTYDAAGNLTSSTDALGRRSSIEYDAHNQATALTDPLGNVTRLRYDAGGRVSAHTDALGHVTEYRYDAFGRLAEVRDAKGGIKRFEHDAAGRLTVYIDCSGHRSQYRYDAANRVTAAIDARHQETHYEYDMLGRLRRVIQPDDSAETYFYDAEGNLLRHVDALGHSTSYRYNGQGLPVSRTDALGQTLGYGYDAALRLVELVNGNGERYRLDYNAEGWLVAETGFDGKKSSYSYDGSGQLTASDCRGQRVDLQRDVCGQLLAKQTADGITRFAYDAAGRLIAVAAPHAEQRFAYDALGQLVEERSAYYLAQAVSAPGGRVPDASFMMTHAYDELGNRIQTVLPNGRRIDILRYGVGHWHGTLWQGKQIVAIERDMLHREKLRRIGAGPQPLQAERSYDPQSRLASITLRAGDDADARPLRQRRFSYDPAGNLLAIEHGRYPGEDALGTHRYAYDPIGQLLSAVQPGLTETFAFDPAGNLIDVPVSKGASGWASSSTTESPVALAHVTQNLLKSYQGYIYRYDEQGNVVHKRRMAGSERDLELAYDSENRLIRAIRTEEGSRSTGTYLYDAFSRRIAKNVVKESWTNDQNRETDTPSRRDENTVVFVWDGDIMVQELRSNNTVTYVYEPDTFIPLARIESQGGYCVECENVQDNANGARSVGPFVHIWPVDQWLLPSQREEALAVERYISAESNGCAVWQQISSKIEAETANDSVAHYSCDHLGTPRELVDSSGETLWSGRFRAWGGVCDAGVRGHRHALKITESDQPIRLQGQYQDYETGLYYNRYRYYDPDSARFSSPDPIGLIGGENTYSYTNNPVNSIDPLGLAKCQKNKPCDPCDGRDPASAARAWQGPGNAPYIGQDSYINTVVKKGTILYTLYPHGPLPGNYFVQSSAVLSSGTAREFNDSVQVAHNKNSKDPRDMRTKLHAFIVRKDTCMAKGVSMKNPSLGSGGATQFFIESRDKKNLLDTSKLLNYEN